MAKASFFWHDYETSGTDPARDRIWQFAGLRTDAELRPLDEPVTLWCRPARDNLPQPGACLVTGLSPQQVERDGMDEADFAAAVHEHLAEPGTCGVGFNSLRFDDAFTRNLLYRNFLDPYAREWRNGNSRWDIIDLARMAHALRPDGIRWPEREDGTPSFTLEDLAAANELVRERGHDALSDVHTTLALARLLKARQPRLWDWYLQLRDKRQAARLLSLTDATPVVHVSSRYPASRGCLALVLALATHPVISNQVIVYDLSVDPTELLNLDAAAIADRVFTPRADLPEDVTRIPLRTVHLNRAPALAPFGVLRDADPARFGLDVDACIRHAKRIRTVPEIAARVREVFAARPPLVADDAELALFDGFPSATDQRLRDEVRATPPEQLAARAFPFADPRFPTLLFRYRARNFPQTLSAAEQDAWHAFARQRLATATSLTSLTLEQYFAALRALRQTEPPARTALLDQLEAWGLELAAEHGIDPPEAT